MLKIREPPYKVLSFTNMHSKTFVAASGNGKLNCGLTSVRESKETDEPLKAANSYSVMP